MAAVIAKSALKPCLAAASVVVLFFYAAGCQSGIKERPYGFFRLGKVEDLKSPETFFPQFGLLLRRDEGGFYVMSTYCTYDLTPLTFKPAPSGGVFVSAKTGSTYGSSGEVLSGPAKIGLPFYELRFDSSTYGGSKDSLYAYVGIKKAASWRLKVDADSVSRRGSRLLLPWA